MAAWWLGSYWQRYEAVMVKQGGKKGIFEHFGHFAFSSESPWFMVVVEHISSPTLASITDCSSSPVDNRFSRHWLCSPVDSRFSREGGPSRERMFLPSIRASDLWITPLPRSLVSTRPRRLQVPCSHGVIFGAPVAPAPPPFLGRGRPAKVVKSESRSPPGPRSVR